jgi:hypothetical protein
MKVREYLDRFPSAAPVTFIKQAAGGTYSTTPIHSAWEWLNNEVLSDYLVINPDHAPIDVTGGWTNRYRTGRLHCAMITSEAELLKQYGEKQGRDMIAYYERPID